MNHAAPHPKSCCSPSRGGTAPGAAPVPTAADVVGEVVGDGGGGTPPPWCGCRAGRS
ncbi:hypothetical protein NKH77_54810 [Streptomyces sp. M19]